MSYIQVEFLLNHLTGWVCDIGKPATSDDILVKVLRAQGAVLYVKTNVPQSLMVCYRLNGLDPTRSRH
jgi:Asp-tRNA(Asn)/Glu-tRNA(Gln) amidotransferase A subunit family amidase